MIRLVKVECLPTKLNPSRAVADIFWWQKCTVLAWTMLGMNTKYCADGSFEAE